MNLQLVYRYILSLSKNENMFYEKKQRQQQQQQQQDKKKKRKENSRWRKSNRGASTCNVNALSNAPQQ